MIRFILYFKISGFEFSYFVSSDDAFYQATNTSKWLMNKYLRLSRKWIATILRNIERFWNGSLIRTFSMYLINHICLQVWKMINPRTCRYKSRFWYLLIHSFKQTLTNHSWYKLQERKILEWKLNNYFNY